VVGSTPAVVKTFLHTAQTDFVVQTGSTPPPHPSRVCPGAVSSRPISVKYRDDKCPMSLLIHEPQTKLTEELLRPCLHFPLPPPTLLTFHPLIPMYISFITFCFNGELSYDFGLKMSQFRNLICNLFKYMKYTLS